MFPHRRRSLPRSVLLSRSDVRPDPERRSRIAAKGGAAVPADKRSFAVNRQLAQDAGRKGGAATGRKQP